MRNFKWQSRLFIAATLMGVVTMLASAHGAVRIWVSHEEEFTLLTPAWSIPNPATVEPGHPSPHYAERTFSRSEPEPEEACFSRLHVAGQQLGEGPVMSGSTEDQKPPLGTPRDSGKDTLFYARAFLDTLISKGTDVYGPVHSPMFVSILDVETQAHPGERLPTLPGQRDEDRARFGGNLFHDVTVLLACEYMTEITGDRKYRKAAHDYLAFFLSNCPQTTTGLFPWGEHAYWDFYREAPGHDAHEYLGGIPIGFWETLWKINASAVRGEADGLINHVVNLDTFDYDRHASIGKPLPVPRPAGLGFMDFPRHGGFYVLVWTFTYSKTRDTKYMDWCARMLDHHDRSRSKVSGLPPVRTNHPQLRNLASAESSLSLAISLLEASSLLEDGEMKERFVQTARNYLDAIARLPHKPEDGYFISDCPMDKTPQDADGEHTAPYRAAYGGGFTADDALLCCAAYRYTKDQRYLELAKRACRYYAEHDPPPTTEVVWAHVYGAILNLFLDVYDQTGDSVFLRQAERYARVGVERLYRKGLFCGATGINHYESQLMVGNLVYGLVWLQALKEKLPLRIEPNYFDR